MHLLCPALSAFFFCLCTVLKLFGYDYHRIRSVVRRRNEFRKEIEKTFYSDHKNPNTENLGGRGVIIGL